MNLLNINLIRIVYYLHANIIKARFGILEKLDLSPNSLLFFRQTKCDTSLIKDGHLLNLFNFKNQFEKLIDNHSKIYYKFHPYYYDVEFNI